MATGCQRSEVFTPAPVLTAINGFRDTSVPALLQAGVSYPLPYGIPITLRPGAGLLEATLSQPSRIAGTSFFWEVPVNTRSYFLCIDTGSPAKPVFALFDRQAPRPDSLVYVRLLSLDTSTAAQNLFLYARDTVLLGGISGYSGWFLNRNAGFSPGSQYQAIKGDTLRLDIRREASPLSSLAKETVVLKRGFAYTILFSRQRRNGVPFFTVLED